MRQLVFASSGSVYGVKEEDRVTENLTLVPISVSVYKKTKMVAERVLLSYQDCMKIHCVRPATVCGYSPRMRLDLSVNMLTMQALRDRRITVFGRQQVPFALSRRICSSWALSMRRAGADPETVPRIEAQFDELYKAVIVALEQANAIYEQLSAQNLNPRTNLFTITSPFSVTTQRAFGLRTLALYGLLVGMVSFILVPLACFIHHYYRREILPPRREREPGSRQPEEAHVERTVEAVDSRQSADDSHQSVI